MRAGRHCADDDDPTPVMVPRSDRPLATLPPARARALKRHLVTILRDLLTASPRPPIEAGPVAPAGFAARVIGAACALCAGVCCKNGADDAYLDERTIARVWQANRQLSARALLRHYTSRLPRQTAQGSCVFHGPTGCGLDRDMRSDVCNAYYCGGLTAWLKSDATDQHVIVLAGEGRRLRTSSRISPGSSGP